MDATICKQEYFQWDDNSHSCLGCVKEGVLSDDCKRCDDYVKNAPLAYLLEPLDEY